MKRLNSLIYGCNKTLLLTKKLIKLLGVLNKKLFIFSIKNFILLVLWGKLVLGGELWREEEFIIFQELEIVTTAQKK
ncbi:hypothetical protein PM10SUCC1_13470 [Propionigenium maris DSM 9537]|uniref:Uncharacterized protein n=1 Tax=Propionigenium maris DSM 9537 TaxID=1123000 RepID=A0A9W6LMT9_9FUSO|nr:hypothetical protein PM10SUCC1_13470 [Propionigenium maris DSM 9537]